MGGQVNVPAITLVFGSVPDACADARQDAFAAGGTYVVVHSIRRAAGTHVSTDAEAFSIAPACSKGTRLDRGQGAFASVGQITSSGAKVTFRRLDDERAEGSVEASFDDGSTFAGDFSIPLCTGAPNVGDNPVCG